MARTTVIELVDDLTGQSGDDVESVTFALDGVDYEIDLGEDNAADLRERLAEFIASAKRTGGRLRRTSSATSTVKRSPQQLAQVREWARGQGYDVAAVGRVAQWILDAFDAAQAKTQAKPRARRRARS